MAKKYNSGEKDLTPEELNQKIREVAYRLYEKRNYINGSEMNDWIEAEKIVKRKKHNHSISFR
ncbi:MAG: DUF2934 domain-containing protein [bacterium]